jgi:hypothetical protein
MPRKKRAEDNWELSDKTIVFQFPTKHHKEVEAIRDLIEAAEKTHPDVTLSAVIAVDGEIGEDLIFKYANTKGLHFVQHPPFRNGRISMMGLRMAAMKYANNYKDGPSPTMGDWNYIIDGDTRFREGWLDFIIETIRLSPRHVHEKGYGFWVNFRGSFGSSGPGDRLLIPRQLPLGSNLGILMNKKAMDSFFHFGTQPVPILPGGCEDPLITTWMTAVNHCLPMRRFKMPAHHPKKGDAYYNKSFIHNKEVIKENNFKLIKATWTEKFESLTGLSPAKSWGGIPDNMEQVGRETPDGKLSPYFPGSDRFVRDLIRYYEDQGVELKEWMNF